MKIDIFSLGSIKSAKHEIIKHRNAVSQQTASAVKDLTRAGYEYMKSIVKIDTGELASSIDWDYDSAKNVGVIRAGTDYAIFVEFGTGIVGASSPHPNSDGWKYDVNNHGESGWWYYDNRQNRHRWTKGQKATAFVYKTFNYLEDKVKGGVKITISGTNN